LPLAFPTLSAKDTTDDCFLFFLMKSPWVVGETETESFGGHDGLPVFMKETSGDGFDISSGGCEGCELADEFPPPQSFRI
jgi:hypothetical protein